MKKSKTFGAVRDFLVAGAGAAVGAFSLSLLLNPGHMSPGGLSAIAAMLTEVLPLKIGTALFVLNVPLLILAYKMDKRFFFKTIAGTVFYSIFANLWLYVPVPQLDNILRSVFGGAAMGLGFGLIFMSGGSSGGSDIIAFLISRKKSGLKISSAILMVDLTIIAVQALVYKSLESGLFASLALFISTRIIDIVVEGGVAGKTVYIVSDRFREIADAIFEKIDRGVTALAAEGMYSGSSKKVLFCTIGIKQLPQMKKIISDIDSDAFVIVTDTREVLGKGFNNIDR